MPPQMRTTRVSSTIAAKLSKARVSFGSALSVMTSLGVGPAPNTDSNTPDATLGREPAARRAAADGQAWVREVHDKHVPAEFRDSFLHRNAINRELLAFPGSK